MKPDEISEPGKTPLPLDELDPAAGGAGSADAAEIDGQILEPLPNAVFLVQLDNGDTVRARISGKLRMAYIRLLPGDRVRVQMIPAGATAGRIVWRYKAE